MVDAGSTNLRIAAVLMPFAGIFFLWFMGVVRDGLGRYGTSSSRRFSSAAGCLFLAMMFLAAGVGAGLEHSDAELDASVASSG